mmetsp:Transcript_52395/g.126802  ORF Transcript_52395/g.126802 Transcript_52395/m.126802 type:complete len:480 (+) Transcript_52395:284-1723(+)
MKMRSMFNHCCTKRWGSSSSVAAAAAAAATGVAVSSFFVLSSKLKDCDDNVENDPRSRRQEISIRTTTSTTSMTTRCDNVNNRFLQQKPQQFPVERSSFYGFSPTIPLRYIQPNDNLEICYDTRTRTPLYVLERLTARSILPADGGWRQRRRRPNFFQDTVAVPEPNFRSTPRHFKGSGYDRGHLAPAADFQGDQQHHQDTFSLCNIVPQNHIMNVTVWNSLEEWTRRVCREKTTEEKTDAVTTDSAENDDKNNHVEMYVITGPLWLPKRRRLDINDETFQYEYDGIGQPPGPLISVPTHLFKVVVLVDMSHKVITEFSCFVVPNYDDNNEDVSNHAHDQHTINTTNKKKRKKKKKTRLEDFLVCWSDLETVSGLQLFPSVTSTPGWKEHADDIARQQLYLRYVRYHQENDNDNRPPLFGNDHRHKIDNDNTPVLLPLLSLTNNDGKNTEIAKAKRKKRWNNNEIINRLNHLCIDGQCQ